MTHSYVWHDSFICVTWLIFTKWRDILLTKLIDMCDVTQSYVWHDSCLCVWHDSLICVRWIIDMCDVTHSYVGHDSSARATSLMFTCVTYTGWRRLIGSPKLQIIFHKRATKYRSLLQKMTYKDKGSYESSPPCIHMCNIYCIHMCDMTHSYVWHESVSHVWHDSFIRVT